MSVVLDILMLLGSLGLFLYGMKLMSEALQKVAGDKMRAVLGAMTSTPLKRVLTGTLVTAVIQSSSATTVMIVSFVNAGLLSLTQSVGVIMGANIGTTITAWIIALLGFKVDIATLAIPVIAIGFPLMMMKSRRNKSVGELVIGFALLFMGLAELKNSVPDLSQNPQIVEFLAGYADAGFFSVLIFVLIGTLLTIVLQSSSATMALTLIMCYNGYIPFQVAVAMVLGENIGTTITANLAAAVANVSAKRAARAHFLFNVIGVCWVLLLYHPFLSLIDHVIVWFGGTSPSDAAASIGALAAKVEELKAMAADAATLKAAKAALEAAQAATTIGLSLFHTMFNIINTGVLIGFTPLLVKAVTWLVKQKRTDDDTFRLKYIQRGMMSTAELSLTQSKMEILGYAKRAYKQFGLVRELFKEVNPEKFDALFQKIQHDEEISDRIELEIAAYLNKVGEVDLSEESSKQLQAHYKAISEVESVCDSNYNLARVLQRKKDLAVWFDQELRDKINEMFDIIERAFACMNENLEKGYENIVDIGNTYECEQQLNALRTQIKDDHIRNLEENKYKYMTGVIYMDMVSECEMLGDYLVNVSETILELKHGL